MRTPTSDRVARLERNVLEGPGVTQPAARHAAFDGAPVAPADAYLTKVRDESFRITDKDIQSLRDAGLSEDEIFELTIAAAMGAASRLLAAGQRVIAARQ